MIRSIALHIRQIVPPKVTTDDVNAFYVCNKLAFVLFIEFEVWGVICGSMRDHPHVQMFNV